MKDQWHDSDFANQWDATKHLIGNPVRTEQLAILLSLIAATYREGTTILDLGIGSGLVEEQLFQALPTAYVVGVDSSQAMLDLARTRLAPFEQRYQLMQHDLLHFAASILPSKTYSIIFSVQVLHHLPHAAQRDLFLSIYRALPPDGLFLLMDRIELDTQHLSGLYQAAWNHLEQRSEIKSGRSGEGFLQQLQDKEDYPATLEEQLTWLREAGFAATCLHLNLNRALFAGSKPQ